MPQPTFSTRKPPKLKRTKAAGAIVRDASARKNPVVNNSAETESSGNPAEGPIQSSSIIAAAHQRGQETLKSRQRPPDSSILPPSLLVVTSRTRWTRF